MEKVGSYRQETDNRRTEFGGKRKVGSSQLTVRIWWRKKKNSVDVRTISLLVLACGCNYLIKPSIHYTEMALLTLF